MCGIVAYHTRSKQSVDCDILVRLVTQAKIRGLHAFGVGAMVNGHVVVSRFFDLNDAIGCIVDMFQKSSSIIIHCRYSTSGDWATLENNQPVVLGEDCLVFNGVISMKTKHGMEQEYGVKLNSDNDGELFLRHISGADDFVRSMTGSFAGVWFHNGNMYMMRNARRPLWYLDTGQSAFIFSTRDIIMRACGIKLASMAMSCDANELYVL